MAKRTAKTTARTARDWFGRGKSKVGFKSSIKSFGDAKHNLRIVFVTRKERVYEWIERDDIKYLEQVFTEVIDKNKFLPANDTAKRSEVNDLIDILHGYRNVAAPLLRMSSAAIQDPVIVDFINRQLAAIENIDLSTMSKPTTAKNTVEQYENALTAIKLLVDPKFTEALWRTIPEPIDPAPRQEYSGNEMLDFMTAMSSYEQEPADLVKWGCLPLDGLFGPTQAELLARVSKQSAKRTSSVNDRSQTEIQTVINNTSPDFTTQTNAATVLTMVAESVIRLSDQTVQTNPDKVSQYMLSAALKKTHDATKVKLYQNKFATKQIGNGSMEVVDKNSNVQVLAIQMRENAQGQVERATIVVPAVANTELTTQAMLIDQLQTMAKAIGAVSVNISSHDAATHQVNIDNILKHAFNALHATLAPKFDNATWTAIATYAADPATVEYTGTNPNDIYAYTDRYRSKQFADFLLSIKPDANKPKTYAQIYVEFSELQKNLKYNRIYPLLRRPK